MQVLYCPECGAIVLNTEKGCMECAAQIALAEQLRREAMKKKYEAFKLIGALLTFAGAAFYAFSLHSSVVIVIATGIALHIYGQICLRRYFEMIKR